jgi:hypothetical protein
MSRIAGHANLLQNIHSTGRRHRPALGVLCIWGAVLALMLVIAWIAS